MSNEVKFSNLANNLDKKNNVNNDNSPNNNSLLKNDHQIDSEDKKLILDKENEKISNNTLDEFLDRVGYNSYHYIMCFIVCFIFFVDGCEMIITNLLLSSLQKEWEFTSAERSLLSSAVFFGFFFGSFISGYLTNKYGRRYPSIISIICVWFFTSLTPQTTNFIQLFILRILVGISIGVVVPGATTIVTESIPTKLRSFTLNILWILYPLGIIYICFVSLYFITPGQDLEWKPIWFINSFTSCSMIFMSFTLQESPRYLILKARYEEAFEILNKIGKGSSIKLTDNDKKNIINEAKIKEQETKNESKSDFNVMGFFEKKYFWCSILLAYLWFIASFIAYGLLYILPKIFDSISKHDKANSLLHMIEAMFILFPCPLFRGLLSEWKVLGRKNAMIVGFAGGMICGFLCIVDQGHIAIFSGMLKFFVNTSLGILSVYTSEVYPTSLRSIALGFGNSITRMGGIVTPFICEYAHSHFSPQAPFCIFVFSCLTGVLCCISLPYETIGLALDSIDENKNEEQNVIFNSSAILIKEVSNSLKKSRKIKI